MFLLEGFDGVEAAGAADLCVAGVEEETLSAAKGKTCTLSKFPVRNGFFQQRLQSPPTLRPLASVSLDAFCAEKWQPARKKSGPSKHEFALMRREKEDFCLGSI